MLCYLAAIENPEDRQIICQAFEAYHLYALSVAAQILGSHALGEEAAQTCWERIADQPEKFLSIPCEKQRAWIVKVVENTAKNMLKREKRLVTFDEETPLPQRPVLADCFEEADRLKQYLSALPEGYRDVIVRNYFLGDTPGEIGKALNLKPSTVSMRLRRGLDLLKKWMAEEVTANE